MMLPLARLTSLLLLMVLVATPTQALKQPERYQRTVVEYPVPDVTLINQHREKVRMVDLLNSDQPVLLDFIYGTCTTICPVLSAGFSNLQKKLGPKSAEVRLISITIDPENDTPETLATYLERYQAQPGWQYLTGTREDIDKMMRAFDAYVPDKMEHYPITFLRYPDKQRWARLYGLIGTRDLLNEFNAINPE